MSELQFTIKDLRAAFLAGEAFESDTISVDTGDKDELTEPDFGEWVADSFNIDVDV